MVASRYGKSLIRKRTALNAPFVEQSLNGTMVNNSLVTKDTTRELSDGDKINFGIKQYMFRIKPESQLLDGMDEEELNAVVDQVESVQVQGAENVVGEEDLSCSVCTELFYDAVTLGCSHTFCKHCIVQWKQRNNVCPMCRVIIKTETPTILINNLVEKVSTQSWFSLIALYDRLFLVLVNG